MLKLVAAVLSLSIPGSTAPDTAGLANQGRARAVLAAAVEAIGGESALRELRSVRREYLKDWVDVGQGARPWSGKPAMEELPAHSGFDDSEALSFLDYGGDRYYEAIRYADTPNDFALVVEAGTPAAAFQTITYVRERPFFAEHPAEERDAHRLRRFRRHPEGLLRAALDRVETLVWIGPVEEGATRFDAIAFADASGTQTRLYFEAASHRLVRSEILRAHRVYGDTTSDTVYADFRRVGQFELPFTFLHRLAGLPTSRNRIRSIAINEPAQEAWFQPPIERVAIEPPPAALAVQTLGDGVYQIRGAYNLMFAEFRDHVLLVEAPLGETYAQECLGLVAATIPGKPIHLVSTHFHFDHIGGVRTAVSRGIPVLTTADTKPVIGQSLASRQSLRPDELARRPRAAAVEVAGRKTVLDDGSQRVELYDFGPTPHVAEILVAYFPRLKLLHVADLFDVLTPELVIAGVDSVVMERRIRDFGLDVERIVPMHGMPVTIEALRRGLQIQRKYEEEGR